MALNQFMTIAAVSCGIAAAQPAPASRAPAANGFPAEAASAFEMFRARDFARAEASLRAAMRRTPGDTGLWSLLVRCLIEQGKAAEGVEELERLLNSHSGDPEAEFRAGEILQDLASRRLQQLEKAAPDSPDVHQLLGKQLESQGRLDEALAAYRKALAASGQRTGFHYACGNVLWKQRDFEAARREFDQELKISGAHLLARLRLGQILLGEGDAAAAAQHLERVAAESPDLIEGRREYGKALRMLGRLDEAQRELEAVARALPDDLSIHAQLGALYRAQGKEQRAVQEMQRHRQLLERTRQLRTP